MRNADLAMYQAKDSGRSRAVFFDSKMARAPVPLGRERPVPRAAAARVRALLSAAVRAATAASWSGWRRLLRWQNPREGLRLPKDFVAGGGAERTDRGDRRLGARERLPAAGSCGASRASRRRALALNVSVQQLRAGGFRAAGERHAGSAWRCAAECSNSRSPKRCSPRRTRGWRCASWRRSACGWRWMISAAGYSSLNYLRQHPVRRDQDRSHVHERSAGQRPGDHARWRRSSTWRTRSASRSWPKASRPCDSSIFCASAAAMSAQGFVLARPLTGRRGHRALAGATHAAATALLRRAVG